MNRLHETEYDKSPPPPAARANIIKFKVYAEAERRLRLLSTAKKPEINNGCPSFRNGRA